jgi:hypothetical protein
MFAVTIAKNLRYKVAILLVNSTTALQTYLHVLLPFRTYPYNGCTNKLRRQDEGVRHVLLSVRC